MAPFLELVHSDDRPGTVAKLRPMLTNLIGNAWKYSGQRAVARIEFGQFEREGETVYFVRDNGVGFDMAYVGPGRRAS
jgi:light-regulated signal transduction histidine kinase (bacteriophytochrome)